MNYLLSLVTLATLVSCNVAETSKSKHCTFNDEPVECSQVSGTEGSSQGEAFTLHSKVIAAVSISKDQIEILENTEDVAKQTMNGSEYECSSGTKAGQLFGYKIEGNTINLLFENSVEAYSRFSGSAAQGLQGTWRQIDNDEMGRTTTTISFSHNTIELNVECQFNG